MWDPGAELDRRRRDIGLSRQLLAERAHLGVATVNRALRPGGHGGFGTYAKLAAALGVEIGACRQQSIVDMREQRAREKARQVVALVQGNSALEAQALGEDALHEMEERTVKELLTGSDRRLWSD